MNDSFIAKAYGISKAYGLEVSGPNLDKFKRQLVVIGHGSAYEEHGDHVLTFDAPQVRGIADDLGLKWKPVMASPRKHPPAGVS